MKFFQLIPSNPGINFISKAKILSPLSVVTIAVLVYFIFAKGFHYGVDFTGGTVIQLHFSDAKHADEVRKIVADEGDPNASVVALGSDQKTYLITSQNDHLAGNTAPLHTRIVNRVGASNVKIEQADVVGPKVGAELKESALKSLIYSILLIAIYIWFRFDARFAPGVTLALVHDVIVVSGFYLFTGMEFTITGVAALLTIAGYSVNDTIVIYDRVRELFKTSGAGAPLSKVINDAINLTLSRTLLTSFVTLLSVVPVAFFCKGEIQSFAMAMIFGIFVGTYSTIYIAAPLTIYSEKWFERKSRTGRSVTAKA